VSRLTPGSPGPRSRSQLKVKLQIAVFGVSAITSVLLINQTSQKCNSPWEGVSSLTLGSPGQRSRSHLKVKVQHFSNQSFMDVGWVKIEKSAFEFFT